MKHHSRYKKLGRKRDQRKALKKSLAEALLLHERITTTQAKAKEIRPFIEKLITKSKPAKGLEGETKSLSSIRYLERCLPKKAHRKIIDEIGPRYKERAGGYTRIIKLPPRENDGAEMAMIELVDKKTS